MPELHYMAQIFERQGHKVKIEYRDNAETYFLFVESLFTKTLVRYVFDKNGYFKYMVAPKK